MKPKPMLIRGLPPAVRAQFKAVCARRGTSMVDAIEALMSLYTTSPDVIAAQLRTIRNRKRKEPV